MLLNEIEPLLITVFKVSNLFKFISFSVSFFNFPPPVSFLYRLSFLNISLTIFVYTWGRIGITNFSSLKYWLSTLLSKDASINLVVIILNVSYIDFVISLLSIFLI